MLESMSGLRSLSDQRPADDPEPRVKVSSNPCRLATADWFTSPSSCLRVFKRCI